MTCEICKSGGASGEVKVGVRGILSLLCSVPQSTDYFAFTWKPKLNKKTIREVSINNTNAMLT